MGFDLTVINPVLMCTGKIQYVQFLCIPNWRRHSRTCLPSHMCVQLLIVCGIRAHIKPVLWLRRKNLRRKSSSGPRSGLIPWSSSVLFWPQNQTGSLPSPVSCAECYDVTNLQMFRAELPMWGRIASIPRPRSPCRCSRYWRPRWPAASTISLFSSRGSTCQVPHSSRVSINA